jgi:hypothetical protein
VLWRQVQLLLLPLVLARARRMLQTPQALQLPRHPAAAEDAQRSQSLSLSTRGTTKQFPMQIAYKIALLLMTLLQNYSTRHALLP